MLHRSHGNVRAAGLEDQITVERGNILELHFADNHFDRVLAEAVTMFVDRPRAAQALVGSAGPVAVS